MFDDIIKRPKKRMLKAGWTFEVGDLHVFYDETAFDELSDAIIKDIDNV